MCSAIDMVLLRRFMTLVDSKLPTLVEFPIQPLVPLVDEFAGKYPTICFICYFQIAGQLTPFWSLLARAAASFDDPFNES